MNYNKLNEWKKRKSVSLNTGNFRVMKEALDRNHETIMDWLGVDYVPEDVARYTEIQELAKLDAEYVIGEHIISFHNDARDPQFFRIEHKGGEDEISMNIDVLVMQEDIPGTELKKWMRSESTPFSGAVGQFFPLCEFSFVFLCCVDRESKQSPNTAIN